jgi:D-sedoheptulose 7-phosphate isomerase
VVNDADFVGDYLSHFSEVLNGEGLRDKLSAARDAIAAVVEAEGKVMFAGNGASASIASHYAVDFTKQAKVLSVSFNDAPLLTAYANDYGYEHWVARAIGHHGRPGDLAVLISTSGRSANIVNAAEACRERGIPVMTFTGFAPDNPVLSRGDINFWAPSRAYNVVEGVHAVWLGLLCDLIIGKREYDVTG